MERPEIIKLLVQHQFPAGDINALETFASRDGFQVITDKELDGMWAFFKQYPEDFEDLLPIITDGNSNYLCVYYRGEFTGHVCFLSHDEMNLSPRIASIKRLIAIINAHPTAWDFMDLPDDELDM
jgi:hypothetical protein